MATLRLFTGTKKICPVSPFQVHVHFDGPSDAYGLLLLHLFALIPFAISRIPFLSVRRILFVFLFQTLIDPVILFDPKFFILLTSFCIVLSLISPWVGVYLTSTVECLQGILYGSHDLDITLYQEMSDRHFSYIRYVFYNLCRLEVSISPFTIVDPLFVYTFTT